MSSGGYYEVRGAYDERYVWIECFCPTLGVDEERPATQGALR